MENEDWGDIYLSVFEGNLEILAVGEISGKTWKYARKIPISEICDKQTDQPF